jgi:fucose 4-O-acetylase-like acetyltransferase
MFWWTDRYLAVNVPNFDQMGNLTYYSLRIIEQAITFAIPSFLFVSGFFIAVASRPDKKTIELSIILTRIKNLVIPFVVWSVLILAARWFEGQRYSLGETLIVLITGRTAPPYYYVPLLVQLLLMSPFLVPLARRIPGWLLLIALVFQLLVLLLRYPLITGLKSPILEPLRWLNRSWIFTSQFFWFIFGIIAGFHFPKIKHVLIRVRWPLVALVIVFFIIGVIEKKDNYKCY